MKLIILAVSPIMLYLGYKTSCVILIMKNYEFSTKKQQNFKPKNVSHQRFKKLHCNIYPALYAFASLLNKYIKWMTTTTEASTKKLHKVVAVIVCVRLARITYSSPKCSAHINDGVCVSQIITMHSGRRINIKDIVSN